METKDKRGTAVLGRETDERAIEQGARLPADDWAVIERLQARNADVDPDEVLADVTAAVDEVRQEMYAERHPRRRR